MHLKKFTRSFWLSGTTALVLSVPVSISTASVGLAQTKVAFQVGSQVGAFSQAVAAAASEDQAIAKFYRDSNYAPIWTGDDQAKRRTELLSVLSGAGAHGLPVGRYDPQSLIAAFRAARTEGDRGRLDVMMTAAMLDYARDVQTGILTPSDVLKNIVREVPVRDRYANLVAFMASEPMAFFNSLPPKTQAYAQMMKTKFELEKLELGKGWGAQVEAKSLKPGDVGPAVLQLRDRLIALKYLQRSVTASYDGAIQTAVQAFQTDTGLEADGVAGAGTIAQINIEPGERLKSVVVAMERERWMNIERGKRHIWVNLTDFTAKIIDNGKITFATRSVIGKNQSDTESPEFSDVMEYMAINPTWNVPRSITTKEYLPMLKRNPNAVSHIDVIDRRGRIVPRSSVNFASFTERNFPFSMKQAPSNSNALGLVKFMFPNKHNIYLHDTPSKSLFAREVRAFSHGCIRLSDPFDFAYALLAVQSDDPVGEFQRLLKSGRESNLALVNPVPVHLVYFTAYPSAKGQMEYRRDVYGRDAAIFRALTQAGVVLDAQQG
jgi:murein L,D-transpeptidase YcbB/YkuD